MSLQINTCASVCLCAFEIDMTLHLLNTVTVALLADLVIKKAAATGSHVHTHRKSLFILKKVHVLYSRMYRIHLAIDYHHHQCHHPSSLYLMKPN